MEGLFESITESTTCFASHVSVDVRSAVACFQPSNVLTDVWMMSMMSMAVGLWFVLLMLQTNALLAWTGSAKPVDTSTAASSDDCVRDDYARFDNRLSQEHISPTRTPSESTSSSESSSITNEPQSAQRPSLLESLSRGSIRLSRDGSNVIRSANKETDSFYINNLKGNENVDSSVNHFSGTSGFWDDLVPGLLAQDMARLHESFSGVLNDNYDSDNKDDPPDIDADTSDAIHLHRPTATHFCFLIHGHRGVARDLWYMEMAMRKFASIQRDQQEQARKKRYDAMKQAGMNATNESLDDCPLHDMIVYSTVCNEGKTTDGIENGGERLVREINEVILKKMRERHPTKVDGSSCAVADLHDVTISIVGNSLGGLYARYSIATFTQRYCEQPASDETVLRMKGTDLRIHLNIFCTTATPHLGVSRHTFLPIPRSAEIGVAHAMGETGRDIFRLNTLLRSMCTSSAYLDTLGSFRKRTAYANAYGTDFPVPTSTAAFLSGQSNYPHYFVDAAEKQEAQSKDSASEYIIATLETPRQFKTSSPSLSTRSSSSRFRSNSDHSSSSRSSALQPHQNDDDDDQDTAQSSDESDELRQMSECLDQLGWKKVFLDMRRELPSMEIPKSVARVILTGKKQLHQLQQQQQSRRASSYARAGSGRGLLSLLQQDQQQQEDASTSNREDEETKQKSNDPVADDDIVDSDEKSNRRLDALRHTGIAQSKDLANVVSYQSDNRLYVPVGHNMMVAFSRSRLSSFLHMGGRPVVDSLARDVIRDIFLWSSAASDSQIPSAHHSQMFPESATAKGDRESDARTDGPISSPKSQRPSPPSKETSGCEHDGVVAD